MQTFYTDIQLSFTWQAEIYRSRFKPIEHDAYMNITNNLILEGAADAFFIVLYI